MSRDDLSDVYLVHPNTLRRVWVGRMPHDNAWALAARCTLQLVVRQKGRDYELLPDGLTAEYKPWPVRAAESIKYN